MTSKNISTRLIYVLAIILLLGHCANLQEEPIDIQALRSSGDDWTIRQDTLADGGITRLHHDKWLMYFVHWRPLTEEKENLSPEYVRHLMLNFWGADMPFTLEDSVRQTQVAGHPALVIDGTIYDGAIRSRFIVWNCPETKRQFVADCNINVGRGTQPELFDLQTEITYSIDCHQGGQTQKHPNLKQEFASKDYNLAFSIPESWRAYEYRDTAWFPDGMTETNGSLWTLLTDSEKYVELKWSRQEEYLSQELFGSYLRQSESYSVLGRTFMRIVDIKIDKKEAKNGCFIGEGTFGYNLKAGDRETTKPFKFRAFLWNYGGRTYFLLASMISLQEFWGIPVDLSPDDMTFDRFIRDEIMANISVSKKECLK
jgi:hypothetical protein